MSRWPRLALVALVCLAGSLLFALFLFVHLLHAPPSHTAEALQYLITSALISTVAGLGALVLLSRFVPSLGVKIGAAFVFGSAAAILNVLYTPWLMFASHADFYLLLITVGYFVAISLVFAYFIAETTTRRLQALSAGANRVAGGEFGTEVEVGGADEVTDLAGAFNRMSRELRGQFERERRLEQDRRDLVAAVSHDLRTPLTSIRAMAEAVADGVVRDPAEVRRYLHLVCQETEHLDALIDDLLELSRLQSGAPALRLAPVPPAELAAEVVEGLQAQARERGIALDVRCEEVPPLALDGSRMQRVLVNLVHNALRHTPPGGQVCVEVRRRGAGVRLTVTDTGEGILPEDQPHIFDQFYRGEKSRSRDAGGSGLGLAIARGIVEAHDGTIGVESAPGGGARFVVDLDGQLSA